MLKIIKWVWKYKISLFVMPLLLIGIGIIAFWALNPDIAPTWTGFNKVVQANGEVIPAKNLWDWLNLLIVPLAISIGIWWLNRTEKKTERELAQEKAELDKKLAEHNLQETTLQSYLDHMTQLLLENGLRNSKDGDEIRSIARSRTLTTLRILDPIRKGLLLQFLREADLIGEHPVINLKWADLHEAYLEKSNLFGATLKSVNFSKSKMVLAYLFKANLSGANLNGANLQGARLIQANLHLANLSEASFNNADLTEADLSFSNAKSASFSGAHLPRVNLQRINLSRANLTGADLSNSDLSMAILEGADLSGAILCGANLRGANLFRANLLRANFDGADLSLANMTEAKILKEQLSTAKVIATTTSEFMKG